MFKMKLEQQHRPFWGWVERNVVTLAIMDVGGVILLAWGYLHIDLLARWLGSVVSWLRVIIP